MIFGSKRAYISKKKIDRVKTKAADILQTVPLPPRSLMEASPLLPEAVESPIPSSAAASKIPESPAPKEKEKEEGKAGPDIKSLEEVKSRRANKLSAIKEVEEGDAEPVKKEKKERSRSRSLSSVSDEELDRFHSDDEEPHAEKLAEPVVKSKPGTVVFKPKMKERDHEEEKRKSMPKSVSRVKEAMERQHKLSPASFGKREEEQEIPLSVAGGSMGAKHEQEVDTNVLSLALSVLKDKTQIATGDPVICKKCKAVFSIHSKIGKNMLTGEQSWRCEFCNSDNVIAIEEEEFPKADELTYVLKSAQQAMDKKGGSEDISIIFCIDVSGSMCVSQPVEGKIDLKYDKVKKLADLMKFSDGSIQYTEKEKKNVTYISRIQCVQAAIEKQLAELSLGAPKRKIGVVTFNNDVNIIGDGSLPPKTITGDKLKDFEGLLSSSLADAETYVGKGIGESKKNLMTRLGEFEEGGQTALGPALLVSLGLATKGTPGSRVIICTDGLANVGLGSVDNIETEEAFTATQTFYTKVGELAKSKGVSISVISMVGDECKLEMLSPLADLTAGDILKVDPANLANDFANILSESIIATNVEVRVKLHKGLTFRNEEAKNISEDGTLLIKGLGNVTEGQEVTLEYCAKSSDELAKMVDIDLSKVTKIPFQTQINYVSLEGMKCVRLITKLQDITFEKEEAKKDANYKVLSVNAVQQTAKMAKAGNYREAQANAYHWKKMMKGSKDYEDYMVHASPLYEALAIQQRTNLTMGISPSMPKSTLAPHRLLAEHMPEPPAMHAPSPGTSLSYQSPQMDYMVSEMNQAQKMNYKKLSKK